MMLRFIVLLVVALVLGEFARLGVNRWVSVRISEVAGPAVALFVMLSVARHPGFGWTEAPMGVWHVTLIAGCSVVGVALLQFVKGWLFRRILGDPVPETSKPGRKFGHP